MTFNLFGNTVYLKTNILSQILTFLNFYNILCITFLVLTPRLVAETLKAAITRRFNELLERKNDLKCIKLLKVLPSKFKTFSKP